MLFGKKKETPKNPYYNGAAKQAGAAPVVNAQIPPPATIAKEMNQQQGTSENNWPVLSATFADSRANNSAKCRTDAVENWRLA
jgi:hypothetical protein